MPFKIMPLWTDILIYILGITIVFFIVYAKRNPFMQESWRYITKRPLAMFSFVILLFFSLIALLDSIHYVVPLAHNGSGKVFYSLQAHSVLDALISPLGQVEEQTYSAPFTITINPSYSTSYLISFALLKAALLWVILMIWIIGLSTHYKKNALTKEMGLIIQGKTTVAWRTIFLTSGIVLLCSFLTIDLSKIYHILGTDKVGQDVFYLTVKSIRTGLVIGTLTTLFMLPFALFFGTIAGYFSGWIDDIVQYFYTTLSSIPGVLLITAAILSLQIFTKNHPELFANLASRADARLLILCAILGVTSWTDLCRLIRGETLKLREMDFVQAAIVMGVSRTKIILQHIIPNVLHIILITMVLDFSILVLAEAVLSYVGVGVDPSTISWGNMINSARFELAREPVVWWPLFAAFILMFTLVLAANLFADAVRDAFDPKNQLRY